jgi:hypothetical protein
MGPLIQNCLVLGIILVARARSPFFADDAESEDAPLANKIGLIVK